MATAASVILEQREGVPLRPAPLDSPTLIVVDLPGRSPEELRAMFPRCESMLLILDHDPDADEAVATTPGITSVAWTSEGLESAIASMASTAACAVFLSPLTGSSGRLINQLRRCGVRRFIFEEGHRWREIGSTRGLTLKIRDRVVREFRDRAMPPRSNPRLTSGQRAFVSFAKSQHASLDIRDEPVQQVDQFIGCLQAGGAERQACTVARALARRGYRSRVWTAFALTGAHRHYLPMLCDAGVPARQAGADERTRFLPVASRLDHVPPPVIDAIPGEVRTAVLDLYAELVLDPPQVLHCWLDANNIVGAIAGVLAGVSTIVVSTRNVNPTAFPSFHQPWMRTWYRALAQSPQVHFVANSRAGAADYASWIGMNVEDIQIIKNIVDVETLDAADDDAIAAVRRALALDTDVPLVTGVFRLSPEKRPERFIEVIRDVRARGHVFKATIVGDGPLRAEVEAAVRRDGLDDGTLHLLGRRQDVPAILAASTVVLLTSKFEGTPNCLLEAMATRTPVVATSVGGVPEFIEHETSGLLASVDDTEALVASLQRLLTDADERTRLGDAGRHVIETHHAESTIVSDLAAMYRHLRRHATEA